MTCEHIRLPDGTGMIVCGSKPWPRSKARCIQCGGRADLECDWKIPDRKSGTCDAPICSKCTTSPAPEKDLCPEHARAWAEWKARRSA